MTVTAEVPLSGGKDSEQNAGCLASTEETVAFFIGWRLHHEQLLIWEFLLRSQVRGHSASLLITSEKDLISRVKYLPRRNQRVNCFIGFESAGGCRSLIVAETS